MELKMRPLTKEERMYLYSQGTQIESQTGCIGYLRADLDNSGGDEGGAFFSSWVDLKKSDLKTQEFKDEFDELINTLREEGGFLRSRRALMLFCFAHYEYALQIPRYGPKVFDRNVREWGIRIDTDKYCYLMRVDPNTGEYNLYCYCYIREWLDRHIENAKAGIRFVTSKYKELFVLKDGDSVRIENEDGSWFSRKVRFIDRYHFALGLDKDIYHIAEFGELVEMFKKKIEPLRASLPEHAYVTVESTGEVGLVKKGERGYTPVDYGKTADELNQELGVTKAQAEAMKAGSLFGWHVPLADPDMYDENGIPIRTSKP